MCSNYMEYSITHINSYKFYVIILVIITVALS